MTRARTKLIGGVERDRRPATTVHAGSVELTERLLETLANVVVRLGLEHVGDPTPVLRVQHLEPARQLAVAFQPALHRGLMRVVEELGVGQQPEVADLAARRVEEVVTRLAGERGVVVDQRRQADRVVGIELPPPARLNLALARLLAECTADEDRLQLARRDRAEILQRGELGLVAVGDDDDQRRQVTIVAPALGLLDLGREVVVIEARSLRRRLAALAQVGDPQFDAFVPERGERVEQPVGVGCRHVANEHADRALAAAHALGDEIGEHLGRCQAGRHLRGSPPGEWSPSSGRRRTPWRSRTRPATRGTPRRCDAGPPR